MRSRPTFWILLVLLCLAGAWLFWPHAGRRTAEQNSAAQKKSIARSFATPVSSTVTSAATAPAIFTVASPSLAQTNEFAHRLSNTAKSIGELARDPKAILLENALIDTRLPLNLSIPKPLQSSGDPGAYIVQANRTIDDAFRAQLARAGAQIISYIPNNAYLVRVSAGGAGELSGGGATVIPYEPYYKISLSLLDAAVRQKNLPDGAALNLGLFPDDAAQTVAQIEKMGGTILATDRSPFGPMVRVAPPVDWTALAVLPGVQILEPYHARVRANDLTRVTTGVAVNTVTNLNYLNLYGSNVLVAVPDSGIDATHPDLMGRVFGSVTNDTVGHGTHVAGIIAGNGTESSTVTNASGSVTNANFRGKAPLAKLFAMDYNDSDQDLQQDAAQTNALISNNSWNYDGDTAYDLEAAIYDAGTRDSLPYVTGSQGVLYVFSAGNSGGGDNNGGGGGADTILSPATAKDVISVGALESLRNITNTVAMNGTTNAIWKAQTDTSYQVANYSSRGNVGVGTEGTYGRFKPDMVAPGTFIISTRSRQWNQSAYYNPTNGHSTTIVDTVDPYSLTELPLQFFVYKNAVGVTIQATATGTSVPLPIYVWPGTSPFATDPVLAGTNFVSLPATPLNVNWYCAVSNTTGDAITYDLTATVVTTNDTGNEQTVLSNLNNSIGPWYRYETGTSMAAPDVSGMAALIQDYFTNTLHALPSPALLKALLINGARPTSTYNFYPQNPVNWEGWGLINLPDSVPTNSVGTNSVFYLDQSPTNALATGDSHTFTVNISSNSLPLRVTLAWTDPAGNPAAAIKLVNNLDLVVSNMATNIVYYGNDIPAGSIYNSQGSTNAPNLDTINNIENVFLQAPAPGNYSVTVFGRGVNVNAVTAQTNNVVQDYALVISCGDGLNPGAITVTDGGSTTAPTSDQLITDVVTTNAPLFNQNVGANPPLLGTNTIAAGGNTGYISNAIVTIGMTNQWHFYVVTNTGANNNFTNAAFITFLPATLSIPRIGVFADSDANSTTPEADIDLYVAGPGDPNAAALTNLDSTVISNCIHGANGDAASLSRGGTEYVIYTNSTPGQVYYVGVKAEDQVAAEFAFLPVFTQTPFSQQNPDGSETVNGLALPVEIPDGSPAHPGAGYVFGIALQPMQIQDVTVSNQITHQNIGDLIGTLTHNGKSDVLNNHDSLYDPSGVYDFLYDDSSYPLAGSQPSDGPGSLNSFVGEEAVGVWLLTEVDDSQSQTGAVTGFSLNIQPHHDPSKGVAIQTLPPGQFYTTYVDVPTGATNMTIFATNVTVTPPIQPVQLYVRYEAPPTPSNYDATTLIDNGTPPSGLISISLTNSPPLRPGRYFIGLFNPGANSSQTVDYFVKIDLSLAGPTWIDYNASGATPLPDDAVVDSTISVTNTDPIAALNVGIRVDHPRISDLVFHLISPDGTRYLLMENRGGTTTNGAGTSYLITNTVPVNHNGDNQAYTNTVNTGTNSGTLTLNYELYVLPDTIDVYYQGINLFHFDPAYTGNDINGTTNINYGPGTSTEVTVIMNAGGNTNYPGTAWNYTLISTLARYTYLAFTEDTNLTTTPIKFAPPPFVPVLATNTTITTNITFSTNAMTTSLSSFEAPSAGDYSSGLVDGWNVVSNQVSVVNDSANAQSGSQFLALASGSISRTLPTVPGQTNILTYAYRGPGIVGLWRGETSAIDSINANNGTPAAITYSAGEVGQAFNFNGSSSQITVPASSSLNVGLGSGFTLDLWINPNADIYSRTIENLLEWNNGSIGAHFELSVNSPGDLYGNVVDTTGVSHIFSSGGGLMTTNVFQHVALTYNKTTGVGVLYRNGVVITNQNIGIFTPQTSYPFYLGTRPSGPFSPSFLHGLMDESSVYNRTLSASEIKAIYNANTSGKYDPAAPSVALGMSKVQMTLSGSNSTFYGNNTTWQSNSIIFVATSNATPLQISGLEPGMLLDSVNLASFAAITNYVTNAVVAVSNLYYFPEQSIQPLVGTVPTGTWTMEVQDDRVGAYDSNSPPALLDWQMAFVFASTNVLQPPVFTNAPPPETNMNELTVLLITNGAVTASTNLTLIYSLTNSPSWATIDPTTGIITLAPLEADGPGAYTITTVATDDGSPPLSAENTFSVTVNEVNTPPFWPPGVPSQTNYTITALNTLSVVNTAIDTDSPPNTLTYRLLMPPTPPNAMIGTNSGIITFTPTLAQTNLVYTFETIVTDTNVYALTNKSLSATNFFTVTVLPPLTLTGGPQTNTIPPGGIIWYLINVPTNVDFATNTLLFANEPLNLWFSTNVPPTITNAPGDVELITNAMNGSSILGISSGLANIIPGSAYYLGVQNPNPADVTYGLEVDFHYTSFVIGPPVFVLTNGPGTNVVYELSLLTVTNAATDSDITTTLGYTLAVNIDTSAMLAKGWPTNFASTNPPPVIDTHGIITWTPTEAQGPGIYDITTIVTNTEMPSLSATNVFTVVVNESNSPPVLVFPANSTLTNIVEGFPLTNMQAVATDSDIPTNALTFALVNGPAGLTMTPNGLINWTPVGTNFLGTNLVSVSVTDTNLYAPTNKSLSVTNTFKIVVWEVNTAPFWTNTPPTNTVAVLTTLVVTNTAIDTDSPPNTLTYTLLNPPTGAVINPVTGVITWTPPLNYANTTNTIQTIVTDFNQYALTNKNLSNTNSFVVIVLVPPYSYTMAATAMTGTNVQLNGMATPNGSPAFAWFEWGTSSLYGNTTAVVPVGSGKSVVYVTNALGGLTLLQAYHYHLVVSNAVAVIYGFDQIFDVGGIAAWGSNGAGQTNVPPILTNTATAIAGGFFDSLALPNTGLPIAWGDNTYLQTNVPASLTNAVAITSGGNFNLALRNNGRVIGWGYSIDGETNVPANLSNVVAIASGGYHSLALRTNGMVVAWGYDGFQQTNVPVNLTNIVAVAGGLFHSLALKNDGTVVAWGDNSLLETNVPAGLNSVVAIAGGDYYSMALKANGTVVVWGSNNEGEGNVPPGLNNVVAIAAGSQHCLALKRDGTVISWGNDAFNQTNVPAGVTNVAAIAGGGDHSLALVSLTPVNLVNTAPFFLATPTNYAINVAVTLLVTNTASDTDVPAQTLTYALLSPSANASVNPTNGIITFTPMNSQAGTTNLITTVVTDNGLPPLSATNFFSVIVYPIPAISSVTFTNIGGTNGFLLKWFAPTNDQFQVQWTASLAPANWQTFSNVVTYTGPLTPTNGLFTFFDNGVQFPFGPMRFYRLILLGTASPANTPPVLPSQATNTINPLAALIVTNTATDSDVPSQTLTYQLSSSVAGTNVPTINTNTGVILWTPLLAQAGTTNLITTVVTDNGLPPLSATNSFSVIVYPIPYIGSVTFTTNALTLHWSAPTNDQFNVQWTTNLASPIIWTYLPNNISPAIITSTNGAFFYTDTNAQFMVEFYRLILLP